VTRVGRSPGLSAARPGGLPRESARWPTIASPACLAQYRARGWGMAHPRRRPPECSKLSACPRSGGCYRMRRTLPGPHKPHDPGTRFIGVYQRAAIGCINTRRSTSRTTAISMSFQNNECSSFPIESSPSSPQAWFRNSLSLSA
jgi:hypothetical protein